MPGSGSYFGQKTNKQKKVIILMKEKKSTKIAKQGYWYTLKMLLEIKYKNHKLIWFPLVAKASFLF